MAPGQAKPALSRKERERLAHRREMLEAAERVFVRKGYHGATVEEIAQEAEFAVGTLYNFFDSKERLYAEVLGKLVDDFLAAFEARVLSEDDPVAAIGALIELRLTHFEEHRGFVRVFFESMPGSRLDPARALPERLAALYDHYTESVCGIFARGIEAGVFDHLDPLYLALCLDGIINAFISYWSRQEPTGPLRAQIGEVKQLLLSRIGPRGAGGAAGARTARKGART